MKIATNTPDFGISSFARTVSGFGGGGGGGEETRLSCDIAGVSSEFT